MTLKKSKLVASSILITLVLAATQIPANSQVTPPNGNLQNSQADDIWPKTMEGSVYNEFWTYHIYLENDIQLTLVYILANFGSLKSPISSARASIVGFDDEVHQVLREYPIDKVVLDKENWIFRPHAERDIEFSGKLPYNHHLKFKTKKDDVSYDIQLELSDIAQGQKWGDGMFDVNGVSLGIISHIPYARVKGFVQINDEKKSVLGTAYMDHTFQNQITTRMLARGFRTIYHNGPEDWEIGYYLLADRMDQTNIAGYNITRKNQQTHLKKPIRIIRSEYDKVDGQYLPKYINIEFESGITNNITRTYNNESFDLLQELSGLARRIARIYLRGEMFEYRGKAELDDLPTPKSIYYNIFLVD